MQVLQLIDSLHAGGAERVAVNYANALASRVEKSFLCATRAEGLLKQSVLKEVHYLFLNKKSSLDFRAIRKLNRFVKTNNITIIHAHASSFFIATIIKILNPKQVLIWHEHYGNRDQTSSVNKFILKLCSFFFSSIITVNKALKVRSEDKLLTKNVHVLANYPQINPTLKLTTLHGETGKRLVCLANLRPDKDHINLLHAFNEVYKLQPNWSLHLVGHFYEDDYYRSIKSFIIERHLEKQVFIYGSCADVSNILSQSTMGVLSSKSEGLPVALLEYGLAELPVIATNVGDCNKVISNNEEGLLVEPINHKVLAEALLTYINDLDLRTKVAKNLYLKVTSTFSEAKVMESLIEIYKAHQK
ncbi:glycosyltransferase [Mariniflexile sp. HMF6888]|uniref:glycosyltransferase n=1 Tax=Mariniflexile sp. HMF6888 TaxID=3373086 RepID=UPI003792A6FF